MKCLHCNKKTDRQCNTCSTPYCNEECQNADKCNHEIFCHPLLHQRIKSCVDYAVKHGKDYTYCLSSGYVWEASRLKITPYGKLSEFFCATCGQTLYPIGSSHYCIVRPISRFVSYPNRVKKTYNICGECERTNKQLCSVTLAETKLCFKYHGALNWLTFLACIKLKCQRVPKDIKQLIYREIDVCHHVNLKV